MTSLIVVVAEAWALFGRVIRTVLSRTWSTALGTLGPNTNTNTVKKGSSNHAALVRPERTRQHDQFRCLTLELLVLPIKRFVPRHTYLGTHAIVSWDVCRHGAQLRRYTCALATDRNPAVSP